MKKPIYIFNIDGKTFNFFKYAIEYIECHPKELAKAIRECEENDVYDFLINNKNVNIEIIKPEKRYVKYTVKGGLIIYLLYIIDIYGEYNLIKTMNEEHFNKLNIEEDEIEIFNYNNLSYNENQ